MQKSKIRNIIVTSDEHCGCQLGLCPPDVKLDEGGTYKLSEIQEKIWDRWGYFWQEWVPKVTKGEPYVWVNNGDALEGVHHDSVTQITQNIAIQKKIALAALNPIRGKKIAFDIFIFAGQKRTSGKADSLRKIWRNH